MNKPAIQVTFTHKVTRDELVATLDRILKLHGCLACGLNGWDGVFFLGDPALPEITKLRTDLLADKVNTVINVKQLPMQGLQFG